MFLWDYAYSFSVRLVRHPNILLSKLVLVLIFSCSSAHAAFFCALSNSGSTECSFQSAAQCRQYADEIKGSCTVNSADIVGFVGVEPVCLAFSPALVQCIYRDFTLCDRDAKQNNAACVNISGLQVLRETQGGAVSTQNFEQNRGTTSLKQ